MCADFLKDNLHKYILESKYFPLSPKKAIQFGFQKAEQDFCKLALNSTNIEKSGSCALIILIIDEMVYIGNVGDCRIIVSESRGKSCRNLSRDHKPEDPIEKRRILKHGGKVQKNQF